ncbi:MAG: hypothetical protein IPJ40_02985 [Saprospirales bacterium]|nr:hypothetical protein [Saprospirales bacterium]
MGFVASGYFSYDLDTAGTDYPTYDQEEFSEESDLGMQEEGGLDEEVLPGETDTIMEDSAVVETETEIETGEPNTA